MKIIDTHLHLWDTAKLHYPWLQQIARINKPFFLEDYTIATLGYEVESMVFVQCECVPEEAVAELEFVNEQNITDGRIKAIVAYAALEKGNAIEPYLQIVSNNKLVKSVRRITENEPGICLQPDFLEAMPLLVKYNLSLDISIKPFQTAETISLIQQCPENIFILNHLGKPAISNNGFEIFKKDIRQFASFPNVVAKISGLITEANWNSWNSNDIEPYIEYAIEQFGFERLMFGSDWPVVLLAGSYKKWVDTLLEITKGCSETELNNLFYQTAKKIYDIS